MAKKVPQKPVSTPKSKPTTYTPKNTPLKRDSPVPNTVSGRPPKKS